MPTVRFTVRFIVRFNLTVRLKCLQCLIQDQKFMKEIGDIQVAVLQEVPEQRRNAALQMQREVYGLVSAKLEENRRETEKLRDRKDKVVEVPEKELALFKENIGKYTVKDEAGNMVMPENTFKMCVGKKKA